MSVISQPLSASPPASRRRTGMLAALAASAFVVIGLLAAAPAHAADPVGPLTVGAGTCVTVAGGSSADGTRAQLANCNSSAAQKWTVRSDGTIRTLGKCLDVQAANRADGTPVQLYSCNGTDAQRWSVGANGSLRALGTCLDATGPSTAPGTALQVWSCHGGDNQRWNLPGGTTTPPTGPEPTTPGKLNGAPYLYLGWGNPPEVSSLMSQTGVRGFTMAFVLDSGGCTPSWDGKRALTGGNDQKTISAIKAAGGQVQVSFGGYDGDKLGQGCSTSAAYAGAVQKVIDAFAPTAVDIDLEGVEYENSTIQDRILGALTTVKERNPGVATVVTLPVEKEGLVGPGVRFIQRAAELKTPIDNYTIMPFNFNASDMRASTVSATEGLKSQLMSARGWDAKTAYAHIGISGMNGVSDGGEITSVSQWQQIRDYAANNGLGRLAFWAVNRDRACGGSNGDNGASCSGVSQSDWAFTRITGTF